jgi:hypothetical protein
VNTPNSLEPSALPAPSERLQNALRLAALDLNQLQPPAALAPAVLKAVQQAMAAAPGQAKALGDQAAAAQSVRARSPTPGRAAALACAAVVVLSVVLMVRGPGGEPVRPGAAMAGFVPVVSPQQWPADDTPAWLVSTELRADRLAALGLPFDPARAGDGVRAELLVRASGQVLAVRLTE